MRPVSTQTTINIVCEYVKDKNRLTVTVKHIDKTKDIINEN